LDWKRGLNALLGKDCDYFGWDAKIGEGCFGHKFFAFERYCASDCLPDLIVGLMARAPFDALVRRRKRSTTGLWGSVLRRNEAISRLSLGKSLVQQLIFCLIVF
jgi:hypothetical protein